MEVTEIEDRMRLLRAIPQKYATPDPSLMSKLPKPTRKDNEKGRCDVCKGYHGLPAVHLDYVGHADVTLVLLEVDPLYSYGWACDGDGLPIVVDRNGMAQLFGWLEVHGHRRPAVGTCPANKEELFKELIGDMLRNGAMRFGIGTALWSKAEREERAHGVEDEAPPRADRRKRSDPPSRRPDEANPAPQPEGLTDAQAARLAALRVAKGTDSKIIAGARLAANRAGVTPPTNITAIVADDALFTIVAEAFGISIEEEPASV